MSHLAYNTRPDSRMVYCNDCGTQQRWGCAECAQHWADFHCETFGHKVTVGLPRRDDDDAWANNSLPASARQQQRSWWQR